MHAVKLYVAILILVSTSLVGAWTQARSIEATLSNDVARALQEAGFDGVEVEVEGRDVVVEGRIPDVAERRRLEGVLDRIDGVGSVATHLTLGVAAAGPAAGDEVPEREPDLGPRARCQAGLDEAVSSARIDFESSSADLTVASAPVLGRIAEILAACGTVAVEIRGHTDASGPRDENLELSLRRAEAVRSALADLGVEGSSLTAVGHGPDRPLVSNETPEGRAVNRRIEFEVQDPDS